MFNREEATLAKRFAAFILVALLVMIGYALDHPETFAMFANVMLGLFGAYVAGQSFTDWKKENGKEIAMKQERG
jgi:uncharacterized membrane protein YeaQ/YmgE (transglycosylase-associated protein family)